MKIFRVFNKVMFDFQKEKDSSLVTDIRHAPLGEIYLFDTLLLISKDQLSKYTTYHYELSWVISVWYWRIIISLFLIHRNQNKKRFRQLLNNRKDSREQSQTKRNVSK